VVNRDPSVEVLCIESPRGTELSARLAESLDSLRVDVVAESTATAAPERVGAECDCLVVVVGRDGVSVDSIASLSAGSTPVVAFVDPEAAEGTAATALEMGATDVVTAAGPDRYSVLAHRVRTAVEHVETAEQLESSRARFEALANSPSLAVATIDETSTVQYASPGSEALFGYTADELVGNSLTKIMPDRLEEPHHAAVAEYLDSGERSLDWRWIELHAQHRDGSEFLIAVTFGEGTGDDGHLFSAIIRDITDRREREERLRTLATAIDETMDGVGILDGDGTYEYVNEAHASMYGYDDPSDLVGEPWQTLYDEDETVRFKTDVLPNLRDEGAWRGEATGVRRDGSRFVQDLSLTGLADGGIICVVRDISDRIERRRELREERQFIDSVMDALPDAFYVLDPDGTFSRWNDQLEVVTGYTDDELAGMHATELVPQDDHDLIAKAMADVFHDREPRTVQSALLTRQGERIPHEFSGSPIVDADDEVVGLAGIGRDISTKRFRQKQLSVLSRVLRHNVRNRTSVIKGNASYVRERIDDPNLREKMQAIDDATDDLNAASSRARRAERLLEDKESVRHPVDIAAIVRDVLAEAETEAVAVRTEIPDAAMALAVGTEPISRAIGEIVQNVVDHVDDPTIRVRVVPGEETVRVRIDDDGSGIPEQERDVILAGEETDLAHSTGLGLWLVEWITSLSGGSLTFEESDLGGTAVVLTFPSS
jgi:PAS domain S-box-containing protein